MMRLIDADALAESLRESKDKLGKILSEERCEMEYRICEGQMVTFIEAILRVKESPTIDAVPVVRCKDCENWDTGWKPVDAEDDEQFCVCFSRVTRSDEFCSRGERRCDNDTP